MRSWTELALSLFFSVFPSKRFIASGTVQLSGSRECQFYLCSVLQCFDGGLFGQVIQVLHDGEEDTKVVHLTRSSCRRGEVDACFSLSD